MRVKYRSGIMGAIAPAIAMLMMDPPDRNPGQQQQQQQQQQPPQNGNPNPNDDGFVSPFASVDRDLLDDATRQSIEAAEQQMRTMHGHVRSAATMQSRLDQTQAELQRLQNETQLRQQQNQPPPTTFKDKLTQKYIARGIDPKAAAELADMNAEIFEEYGQNIEQNLGQRFAPIAHQVFDQGARDAFSQAQAQDTLGAFQHEDISQYVWDRVQGLVQNGQMVTPELCQNFAYIAYGKALAEGKIQPNTPPPQTEFPVNNPTRPSYMQHQQQQTRFTFPGAGHNIQRPPANPNPSIGARPSDAETDAAMAATVQSWPVQPKAYKTNGKAPSIITRGA